MTDHNEVVIRARRLLALNKNRQVRGVVEALLRYIELLEEKIEKGEKDVHQRTTSEDRNS